MHLIQKLGRFAIQTHCDMYCIALRQEQVTKYVGRSPGTAENAENAWGSYGNLSQAVSRLAAISVSGQRSNGRRSASNFNWQLLLDRRHEEETQRGLRLRCVPLLGNAPLGVPRANLSACSPQMGFPPGQRSSKDGEKCDVQAEGSDCIAALESER